MPTISIIVPVYKVESYIHRCIDSILSQTFTDFELILVDDGSPDNCGTICDDYAAMDSRVKVIHQPNGGASSARNAGIDAAQGEYLMFCDSDDMVSPMWVGRLMQYADGKTLPMGAYCHEVTQIGMEKRLTVSSAKIFDSSRYYAFGNAGIAGYLCNSLFVTRIVKDNGLRFRENREQGDYNEDLLFTLQYVRHIEKIVYTGYADYLYDTHEGSLSRSYSKFYFPKYQEKFWLWYDFLEEYNGSHEDLTQLVESSIYHFLVAAHYEFYSGNYRQFRDIVRSQAVEKCLSLSPCGKEGKRVVSLLKKKAAARLWLLFTLSSMKGRKQK